MMNIQFKDRKIITKRFSELSNGTIFKYENHIYVKLYEFMTCEPGNLKRYNAMMMGDHLPFRFSTDPEVFPLEVKVDLKLMEEE